MSLGMVALFSGVGVFVLMLGAAEIGRRAGFAWLARNSAGLAKGSGATEGAMFALFGLLIAFTFSGAASRFEDRRDLITDEANAIGTAYLRLDLLPSAAQPQLRDLFRRYVDTRYQVYRQANDAAATEAKLAQGRELQAAIWTTAVSAVQTREVPTSTQPLLLGALNEMIDITETRQMATRNHPPLVVFLLLGGLSLVCAFLVGYSTSPNASRSWFHIVSFSAIVSMTVYVIIDLEFPRLGFIRVDSADEVLAALRASMQ